MSLIIYKMDIVEVLKKLLNPEFYIRNGGLWLVVFIVFAETGLFVGFFLPGDSLLFVAGIYAIDLVESSVATFGNELLDVTVLASLVSAAAIVGNLLGYWFGDKGGPRLYQKKDTWYFKKKYLHSAHEFFDDHGKLAIIMARFLPVVRTFAPVVAGIVKMPKGKFVLYSIVGGVLWSFSLIFAGHYLYKIIKDHLGYDLTHHLEVIILVIVVITTGPVLFKFLTGGKKKVH